MKKLFTISSVLAVATLITFACKKSSSSSSSSSSTPTGTTAPANTVTLTTSAGSLTGTITPSCYTTSMYGTCSNIQIGSVNLTFPAAPTASTYSVVSNAPTSSQVMVAVNGNYALGGTVAISVVSGKNKATFNNVTSSTFTLTGSYSCP